MPTITWTGLDSLPYAAFSFAKVFNEWSNVAGPVIRDAVKYAAPVRTGKLAGSITYEVGGQASLGNNQSIRILSNCSYASYVVGGTQPHVIYGNPLLAFQWHGKMSYFHFVHHPGTKANDFPSQGYANARDTVIMQMVQTLQENLGG